MKLKNKILKRLGVTLAVIAILLLIIKQQNMTWRQSILKAFYPALMSINKMFGAKADQNKMEVAPIQSFYNLEAITNNGDTLHFDQYRGKKVLIVNTASNCGYTGQYAELQELYNKFKNTLVIIGFPANDFKEQEKGTDAEIATFCKINYGVTFPLAKKSVVVKGSNQNEVFQWLSDKNKNGWNNQQPTWNFSKYLINEQGVLVNYFDPGISPMSKEIIDAVEK